MSSLYDGPIIDAHHHLWDLGSGRYSWLTDGPREVVFGSTAPLIRDYLLADYLADMESIGLVKSVHIQASFLEEDPAAETRWLQGIADEHGFPHGIVAYAQLERPDAEAVLEAHRAQSNMRGIRQILSWHQNPVWSFNERSDLMQDSAWRRGFGLLRRNDLSFDMMIYSGQLGEAQDSISPRPSRTRRSSSTTPGAPRTAIDDDAIAAWRKGMSALAGAANVAVKISDLGAYDHNWTTEQARGPSSATPSTPSGPSAACSRAIFPSPASTAARTPSYDSFKTIVADLSEAEQRALFHDNAVRFYRLGN